MSSGPVNGAYEIIRYRPEFADAVNRLHSVLTPAQDPQASAQFLRWKYDLNPYLPERLIYLALHEGKPVGMRGVFGTCWETKEGLRVMPCAGDLVIAPGHRDRGLVGKITRVAMAELAGRGFSHLFNLSAAPITALGALALGFKIVAPVEEWLHAPEPPAPPARGLQAVMSAIPSWPFGKDRSDIQIEAAPRAGAMAALIEALGSDGRIRHRRDAAYLGWRYQNPLSRYRFFYHAAAAGTGLDGYLVLAENGDNPLVIMDWEAADARVAGQLLGAALRRTGQRPMRVWRCGLGAMRAGLIAACGFVPENPKGGIEAFGIQILVKALTDDPRAALGGSAVFDAVSWDHRALYADIY